MEEKLPFYRGCLLGMAIGDAMGYRVDSITWQQIQEDYGPNGLMGYDLKDLDYAPVTSYTQIAAFLCNGMLLGLSRARGEYLRWCKVALKEWNRSQQFYRDPEDSYCFLCKIPSYHRRYCRDPRMQDNLRLEAFGSVAEPRNNNSTPGAITAGIAAGLLYQPDRISPEQLGELAAELIALTHGNPETFLSGVVLAYSLAGILHDPGVPLSEQFMQAVELVEAQYGSRFPQMVELSQTLRRGIGLSQAGGISKQQGIERLECMTASQCLAGAMYACLASPDDFDEAIVTAVNHSGLSAAVGALTGAIMGARLGEGVLPDFYLESLEDTDILRVLAVDMATGTRAQGLFDDSWDHKYEQGLPPEI